MHTGKFSTLKQYNVFGLENVGLGPFDIDLCIIIVTLKCINSKRYKESDSATR